eukprot:CAMPEP_0170462076 /NCGR_PEP_ID=MMETSP0123-20130129/7722_1 /TAXON_ID=182087 /ORGANISM="Favella ehrenbergii, Strain Fehren 1" /LENGTH=33 /DNA_ID= /DNA_START= /DNA_END= /DNA_ORIENTATION=
MNVSSSDIAVGVAVMPHDNAVIPVSAEVQGQAS